MLHHCWKLLALRGDRKQNVLGHVHGGERVENRALFRYTREIVMDPQLMRIDTSHQNNVHRRHYSLHVSLEVKADAQIHSRDDAEFAAAAGYNGLPEVVGAVEGKTEALAFVSLDDNTKCPVQYWFGDIGLSSSTFVISRVEEWQAQDMCLGMAHICGCCSWTMEVGRYLLTAREIPRCRICGSSQCVCSGTNLRAQTGYQHLECRL